MNCKNGQCGTWTKSRAWKKEGMELLRLAKRTLEEDAKKRINFKRLKENGSGSLEREIKKKKKTKESERVKSKEGISLEGNIGIPFLD